MLTRAVDDNAELRSRLEGAGATVIERPMMSVEPPDDGGTELRAAVGRLASYHWLVVTSVNGARAVDHANRGRPWPPTLRVAAVGPATAAALAEAGLAATMVPAVATAADLVQAFPVAARGTLPERVLTPLAELASDVVEVGLAAKGYEVERVTAYRTEAPDPADEAADPVATSAGPADAVAFFSPSAVSRYVERHDDVPPLVVCVGPATAARATTLGLPGVVVAVPHSTDGVLAALGSALALTL